MPTNSAVAELTQTVEKLNFQAVQKGSRYKARDKPTSGGVLKQYVGARRLSATK